MQVRRLKTRAQFQAVLAGTLLARSEHFVMHRMALDSDVRMPASLQGGSMLFDADALWFGAMVPKRWARRAVTRNLIKRQIYSAAILHTHALPRAAYLVRLRAAFDRLSFKSAASDALRQAVREEIDQLFSKAAQAQGPA